MPGGLRPPQSVIDTWPQPNYVDPPTRGPALEYVCIIFSAVGLLLVSARIYSRLFITKAPGFDDVLVVISVAFGIALSVLVIIGNKEYATGYHVWDVQPDKYAPGRLNVWCSEWCYVIASCSVKISILLFYRRLSVTFSNAFLIATYIGIAYNICYMIAFLLTLLLICRPVAAYWLSFDPQWLAAGNQWTCGDEGISLPISGAFSVVGDFYSTVLPLVLIAFLNLPPRQKTALYMLFAIGFLVVAAGIVRTIFLNIVINETYDFSWALWDDWIWTIVELYLAIMAASAPALKPFFRKFFIDPIRTGNGSRQRSKAYGNNGRMANQVHTVSPGSRKGHLMSNNSTTAIGSPKEVDVERIGVALGAPHEHDEDVPRYEMRSSRDGKGLVPVQVVVKESYGWDAASNGTSESESWILPKAGAMGEACELRKLRAEVEALPPVPQEKSEPTTQLGQGVGLGVWSRSNVSNTPARHPSTGQTEEEVRRPRTRSSGIYDHVPLGPLQQNPIEGNTTDTIRTTRMRMQQREREEMARQINEVAHRHQNSYSDNMNVPISSAPSYQMVGKDFRAGSRLDLDDEEEEGDGVKRTSSAVAAAAAATATRSLGYNVHGSGTPTRHDRAQFAEHGSDETLHLPRQGSRQEQYEDRNSGVGYAI